MMSNAARPLVTGGARERAAQRLADLRHAEFVERTLRLAAVADASGEDGLGLWAAALREFVAQGATRGALATLTPKAPRGGAHGRSPAVERAPELLAAMRRKLELEDQSHAEAARQLRNFIVDYWRSDLFAKCQRVGSYPDPDTPHYQAHDLILSDGIIYAGDVIGEERIARHLSRGSETPNCLSDGETR